MRTPFSTKMLVNIGNIFLIIKPLRQQQSQSSSITEDKRSSISWRLWQTPASFHAQELLLNSSSWIGRVPNFRQKIRQSHYRNDPVKYDLGGCCLCSGFQSRATEKACFDGVLFTALGKRLSIVAGDFSLSFWCPLGEKAQQIAVAQTTCSRFQVQSSEQIEKSDANAICVVFCVL